jgi:hypothetical protein
MKKEVINHFLYLLGYLILIVILNSLYSLKYYPLILGALVGIFLPYIDHLLHVYFISPQELNSQRIKYMILQKQIKGALQLLYETAGERTNLAFHTLNFQLIFIVLTFWIISSSGSYFGKGLVLAFFLSLFLQNLRKYLNKEILFVDIDKTRIYFIANILFLIIFAILV